MKSRSSYAPSSTDLATSIAFGLAANALGGLAAAALCLDAPPALLVGVLSGVLAAELGLFVVWARGRQQALRERRRGKRERNGVDPHSRATRTLLRFARRASRSRDTSQINRRLDRALRRTFPDAQWNVYPIDGDLDAALDNQDTPVPRERIRGLLDRTRRSAPTADAEASVVGTLAGTTCDVSAEDGIVVAAITDFDRTRVVICGQHRAWTPEDLRLVELFVETAASAQRNAAILDAALKEERLADLGRITAAVAHELNNPLTFLRGNLEVLAGQLEDDLKEAAQDSLWGVKRIARIVGELSSLNRGGQTIETDRVDLVDVVRASVRLSRGMSDCECEVVAPKTLPIECDVGRTEQALVNLLTNAVEASRPALRPRIVVRVDGDGDFATVRVEDNGPGIPAKVRDRLFDAFVTSKGSSGTGLGLYLARSFVEAQSGRLTLEQTGARGTTFAMRLPRSANHGNAFATEGAHRPRVLIVDDEPEAVRSLMRLISTTADVVGTTEPDEALRLALTRPFSAILCDLHMRPFGGSVFLERLRESDPQQAERVIIVTGSTAHGMDGTAPVLSKPVDKVLLHQKVSEMKDRFRRSSAAVSLSN